MEAYELYIAQEEQTNGCRAVIAVAEVEESAQLLQITIIVGREVELADARGKEVQVSRDGGVAALVILVGTCQIDDAVLRTVLIDVVAHELQEEAVAALVGGVHLQTEVPAVVGRCGHHDHTGAVCPDVGSVARGIERGILAYLTLGGTKDEGALLQSLGHPLIDILKAVGTGVVIDHRGVELLLRDTMFAKYRLQTQGLEIRDRVVGHGSVMSQGTHKMIVHQYVLHVVGLDILARCRGDAGEY